MNLRSGLCLDHTVVISTGDLLTTIEFDQKSGGHEVVTRGLAEASSEVATGGLAGGEVAATSDMQMR